MIRGLHHVNIVTSDAGKAAEFFGLFGFDVSERKELSGKWIDEVTGLENVSALYIGLRHPESETAVELLQYLHPAGTIPPSLPEPNAAGIRHLAFKVDDIEEEMARLGKYGVEFFSPLQVNPYGKKMVYLKGPDGIILELAEF